MAIKARKPIQSLNEYEGWHCLKALIQTEIANQTPVVTHIENADKALYYASKMAFVSGLRKVIQLVESNSIILKDLEKSLQDL
jgi:hypothetical protein